MKHGNYNIKNKIYDNYNIQLNDCPKQSRGPSTTKRTLHNSIRLSCHARMPRNLCFGGTSLST